MYTMSFINLLTQKNETCKIEILFIKWFFDNELLIKFVIPTKKYILYFIVVMLIKKQFDKKIYFLIKFPVLFTIYLKNPYFMIGILKQSLLSEINIS